LIAIWRCRSHFQARIHLRLATSDHRTALTAKQDGLDGGNAKQCDRARKVLTGLVKLS
jgi:hypothetical protein